MISYVQISLIHRYWYTRHYYCMFLNHWYTDTLLHWILLHGYSVRYRSMFIPLLNRFTGIHVLIVYIFLLHGTLYILHELLLIDILVFPLHDCFSLLILIFPLVDMWTVDMWCVEQSVTWIQIKGATSRIPCLLFPIFHYLILYYQQSSYLVIVLHVPCTIYLFLNCVD